MQHFLPLFAAACLAAVVATAEPPAPNRYEDTIRKFEEQDKKQPPPQNAILFAGSSTIRLWDTQKCFPDLVTINRGFGGSITSECTQYADRITIPYKPSVIVFYAGDNDIAHGLSPQQVADDFKAFVKKVREALPRTRIIYLGIKPSIARWALIDKMREANGLIRAYVATDPLMAYVDTSAPMIGPDGKPKADLLAKDGLHLNDAGYTLWTSLVKPLLSSP